MTVSTLRPNGTTSNTGAVTGAGGVLHTALSDDSDSTYNQQDLSEVCRVTLGDLSLPAGAVIKSVAARVRSARVNTSFPAVIVDTGIAGLTGGVQVSWATPTTVTAFTVAQAGITDSQIDSAYLNILNQGANPDQVSRIYEAYLDVTYVALPVVSADSPSGTITDTNLPTVTWSNTLDSDGGPQTAWRVRVFTDAQYLAGGFDPLTSTSTADSGVVFGTATSWQVPDTLPDDTYRAYVAVAQTVNNVFFGGDLSDFTEFTVDVDLPGTPTFTATADNTNGRIALAITDNPGTVSTDGFELERSLDGGTTFEPVRTLDGGVIDVPFVVAVGEFPSTADATSHALVLPSPAGGILENDLLIAVVGMDGNPTMTWPAGWTEIKDEAGNGSAVRAGVAWKRAVGGESGTITLTTSASEGGGARILCVRNASEDTAPEVSAGVSSSAANANPDSLNPAGWGTENTLWIAAMVLDGNVAVTAGPANYFEFGNTRWANASGAGVATASRLASAASEDPGAFTHTLEDSRAWTIGVRPRNAALTVWDYEAPNGTTMQYRARSLHDYNGVWAASAWASDSEAWTSTSWWVKHPNQPTLNTAVTIRSYTERTRAGRQGVFQALGSSTFVVVSDKREANRGTIVIRCDSLTAQADLDDLLDSVGSLLIQGPANSGEPGYVRVLSHSRAKFVDMQDATRVADSLEWAEVPSPAGDVVAWP